MKIYVLGMVQFFQCKKGATIFLIDSANVPS